MAQRKPANLSDWMKQKGFKDEAVAPLIKLSRVQVSRIRRGKSGVSKPTAHKLAKLTGIPWHAFMAGGAQ